MKLEVWSDVICPWCGLGQYRLDEALRRFEHGGEVTVVHRSFQLDPSAPVGKALPVHEALSAKTGAPVERVREMTAHVEGLARAEGLTPYVVGDNVTGSTALVHEFLAHATAEGLHTEAWDAAFESYFGRAESIFTVDALVALGERVGLAAEGTRAALTDRRYRPRVEAEAARAAQLGATGVPFTVIDDRFGVMGAQDVDTLLDVLRQAWAATHPEPRLTPLADPSGVCGSDGCTVPDDHAAHG
ncbi:DsbA family protein [Streptomyces sp. MS19]|uniref:DsbA family oxidoreductase n=1 Tax=Streptomyces sp. MS19 TaxID=3385972 RepID=UPI00399EEB07